MQNRPAGGAAVRRITGHEWVDRHRRRGRELFSLLVAVGARHARRLVVALVVAGVGALAVAWVLWMSPWARVTEVDVRGVEAGKRAQVAAAAGVVGQPLVEVDPAVVGARVAASGPYAHVDVARHWPAGVVVDVVPRRPVLAVVDGGRRRLVDESGVAYAEAAAGAPGVPEVVVERSGPADAAPAWRAAVDAVLAFPPAQRGRIEAVRVDADGRLTLRLGGVDVAWGDATQASLKARVVSALVAHGGMRAVDVTAPRTPATTPREAR